MTGPTTHAANGTIESRGDDRVLRYERRFAHPIERVWAALTERSELHAWLADAELDLRPGGRVRLAWLNTDDRGNHAVATGTVTALEPPHVFEIDIEPHGRLRWELREEDAGTLLVLTVALRAPSDQIALALAGWHIHLEHLADALDGRPVDWPAWDAVHRPHWEELHAAYLASSA